MSGTASKITGLAVDGATPVLAGAALKTKWTPFATADEYRQEGRQTEAADGTKPAAPAWASWGRVTTASFSKGGLPNGVHEVRVIARRAGSDIAGSTSDPIAVRVGPAPATQPATPAPSTPAPATISAADFAALRDRVAALETAVAALKAQAAAPISASGTLALSVQGQAGEVPAKATLTLTPAAAPAK